MRKTERKIAQLGSKGTDDNVRINVLEANGGCTGYSANGRGSPTLGWVSKRLARAAADQGLGPTFLNETALLVENSAIPGDFTAPAIPAGFQGLDPRDPMERVAEDDRVMEFPFEDGQKRQGIDSRGLTHQARGDRQTEKPMSDRPAKRAEFRRDVIHMDWVEISGESREQDNIRLGHRPYAGSPTHRRR